MILLLAASRPRRRRRPPPAQRAAFAVPHPTVPLRDVVRDGARGARGARIAATASSARYPLDDGSGDSIAVDVSAACQRECDAADPQAIANTIGTLHPRPRGQPADGPARHPVRARLRLRLRRPVLLLRRREQDRPQRRRRPGPDGASREFVLAHEYGHHVAQHRDMPAPFPAAIDWGPERWSSVEHVCQGHRTRRLLPRRRGHALLRGPGRGLRRELRLQPLPRSGGGVGLGAGAAPEPRLLRALREDTLRPWLGRHSFTVSGRVPRDGAIVQEFRTPFDGKVSIGPAGDRGPRLRADRSATAPARHCAPPARASPPATASTTPSAASPACASRCRRSAAPASPSS